MDLMIDTCVFHRCRLEEADLYRGRFGPHFGFELLPMFDLSDFEENLEKNLEKFRGCPLFFHEPVWGVEHSAPRGSSLYEEGMYHIRLTRKYADILRPSHMVYHLSNCAVTEEKKDEMLRTSLENLEEMRSLFPDVCLLIENTGTKAGGDLLLNQDEFTDLCRERRFDVLIDTGHANANGWDLFRLIRDLKDNIRGFHFHNNDGYLDLHDRITDGTLDFDTLMPFIRETVPAADWVIEYTRPEYCGDPLIEDIEKMRGYMNAGLPAEDPEGEIK